MRTDRHKSSWGVPRGGGGQGPAIVAIVSAGEHLHFQVDVPHTRHSPGEIVVWARIEPCRIGNRDQRHVHGSLMGRHRLVLVWLVLVGAIL